MAAPVIFLDIDGVLNRTMSATHIRLDDDLVERLRQLIAATGSKIVLSTFWRHFEEYIRYVLHRHGIAADAIIGRTPGVSDASSLAADAADPADAPAGSEYAGVSLASGALVAEGSRAAVWQRGGSQPSSCREMLK